MRPRSSECETRRCRGWSIARIQSRNPRNRLVLPQALKCGIRITVEFRQRDLSPDREALFFRQSHGIQCSITFRLISKCRTSAEERSVICFPKRRKVIALRCLRAKLRVSHAPDNKQAIHLWGVSNAKDGRSCAHVLIDFARDGDANRSAGRGPVICCIRKGWLSGLLSGCTRELMGRKLIRRARNACL